MEIRILDPKINFFILKTCQRCDLFLNTAKKHGSNQQKKTVLKHKLRNVWFFFRWNSVESCKGRGELIENPHVIWAIWISHFIRFHKSRYSWHRSTCQKDKKTWFGGLNCGYNRCMTDERSVVCQPTTDQVVFANTFFPGWKKQFSSMTDHLKFHPCSLHCHAARLPRLEEDGVKKKCSLPEIAVSQPYCYKPVVHLCWLFPSLPHSFVKDSSGCLSVQDGAQLAHPLDKKNGFPPSRRKSLQSSEKVSHE